MTPTEQQLLDLEHQFFQTMIDRDVETAIALTDDPCIVAGAQGTAKIDHAMFRRMMTDNKWGVTSLRTKSA